MGGCAVRTRRGIVIQAAVLARGTAGTVVVLGLADRGEGLRRSHDDAAGAKPGASPVDRTTVNVGTIGTSFPCGDRCVADRRVPVGRSRRSTPSRGEPVHMGKDGSGRSSK